MHIEQAIRRATLLLAASAVAACAGGGGGGLPIAAPSIATPSLTQNLVTTSGDAGSFAPVPAPLSAGVTLDGSSGMFPASGSFTVTYATRSARGTPVSGHDGMAIFTTNGSATSVQLVIPSLNISTTLVPRLRKGSGSAKSRSPGLGIDPVGGLTALAYMVLGPWFGNSVGYVPQLQFESIRQWFRCRYPVPRNSRVSRRVFWTIPNIIRACRALHRCRSILPPVQLPVL